MNDDGQTEACGRCAMSTVVDAVHDGETERDPFGEEAIEVEEAAIRRVSPAGYLSDLKARVDAVARRIAYGK